MYRYGLGSTLLGVVVFNNYLPNINFYNCIFYFFDIIKYIIIKKSDIWRQRTL